MKILITILLGLFLVGCQTASDEVTKIEFAKGTCFGPCIPMAISIDDSLHYKLYADSSPTWNKIRPKKNIVSYIGSANQQLWNELIKKLDSIDYKHFDSSKDTNIVDVQYVELIIYSERRKNSD